MPSLSTVYCTSTDLELWLSSVGVTLRADDDDDGLRESGLLTACIEEASEFVNVYGLVRYTAAQLATSVIIKWATRAMAALILCRHRNNEGSPGLQAQVAMYFGDPPGTGGLLAGLANGTMPLPGIAGSVDRSPALSNYEYDGRYPGAPARVQVDQSTGGTSALSPRNTDDRSWWNQG